MKRSTKIIGAVVLSVSMITGATAFATYKQDFAQARADFMVSYVSDELSLNDSQTKQLELLTQKVMAVKNELKAESKPLHQDIENLIKADKFDQQQALEMLNNKTQMINQAAPEVITAIGNFLDGLSTAQKGEILEFLEKKSNKGHGWKHH